MIRSGVGNVSEFDIEYAAAAEGSYIFPSTSESDLDILSLLQVTSSPLTPQLTQRFHGLLSH